jgi:hypothetical protein
VGDTSEQWFRLERIVERFEAAWKSGPQPDIADHLCADAADHRALLLQLVRSDLEQCLKAGKDARVETYLERFPELAADTDAVAELVVAEYDLRLAQDRHLNPDAMRARFPQCEKLAKRIEEGPTRQPVGCRVAPETLPAHSAISTAGPNVEPALPALIESFGRYRIVSVLGQGAMGTVYHAHDTQLDRAVALKVMRFGAGNPEQVERFYREARIAAAFTHPNLCPVYDFDERGGVHYLTMPRLGGEPLSKFLAREAPLPESTAARLTALIARAVHEAHLVSIIHRDLKPSNIMMNERQQPVVMDFGLARRVDPVDARLTAPGAPLGTPAYMPPEVVADGSAASGPAHDIYSLGVILYEMLTGRLPFSGTVNQVIALVQTQEPAPPSHLRPGLDPRLESVCLTAIAKDRSRRFSSMEVFADALEPLARLEDRPTEKTGAAVATRRRQIRCGALVMIVVLILGGGSWIGWHVPGLFSRYTDDLASMAPAAAQNAVDDFQPGREWVGFLRWRGTDTNRPVLVTIKERDGNRFTGIYNAEVGDYLWRIEGSIQQQKVEWRFADIIHEKDPKRVARVATISGTLTEDGRLEAQFQGPDGRASVVLKPKR